MIDSVIRVTDLDLNKRIDELEIGSSSTFSTHFLERESYSNAKAIIYDAFIVTIAIEYSDRIIKRRKLSKNWGRNIAITIPVFEYDKWNQLHDLFCDVLATLTGDFWDIKFVHRRDGFHSIGQSYLNIPSNKDAILAYSEGLDSRAVADILSAKKQILRVRVNSKFSDEKCNIFTKVPYKIRFHNRNKETSFRSRGFKFSMITSIAAYMTKTPIVIIPESGQGALSASMIQPGHIYPDYRNHPYFIEKMRIFVNQLLEVGIRFDFPRLWYTKGETLVEYINIARNDEWKKTKSCWKSNMDSSFDGKYRQCGICAACLLRRLSLHTAGLSESNDTYIYSNINAENIEQGVIKGFSLNNAFKDYARAGILHWDYFAQLGEGFSNHIVEKQVKLISSSMNLKEYYVREKLKAMIIQHGKEWERFLSSIDKKSFIHKLINR